MDTKEIAKYALSFMGGKPKVTAYYNDDETKTIDILTCTTDSAVKNISLSTIGLSEFDIDKEIDSKTLTVELAMYGRDSDDVYANILSSVAFVIQEGHECDFGMIINDVVSPYVKNTELQHVILMHPVFWDKYSKLETVDEVVAWLLAVPITDAEKQYIRQYGIDEFDKLLFEKNVDVTDLCRISFI